MPHSKSSTSRPRVFLQFFISTSFKRVPHFSLSLLLKCSEIQPFEALNSVTTPSCLAMHNAFCLTASYDGIWELFLTSSMPHSKSSASRLLFISTSFNLPALYNSYFLWKVHLCFLLASGPESSGLRNATCDWYLPSSYFWHRSYQEDADLLTHFLVGRWQTLHNFSKCSLVAFLVLKQTVSSWLLKARSFFVHLALIM